MPPVNPNDCQWLSVTEETLFLHDGLLRVTDLVELPKLVKNGDINDNDVSQVCFESKDPKELTKAILAVCGTQNNSYSKLLEYRLNALYGLWKAYRQIAIDEQDARSSVTQEETVAILKKQGLLKDQEQASFSTRISLLLILPLLQSLSNSDKALCGVTAKVLLEALKDCPPLSLAREPEECLKGLENLLCNWIEEKCREESKSVKSEVIRNNQETAACALVALACARGHLETFIHTVHLLQQCPDIPRLPVSDILTRLLETEGGTGQPSALLGTRLLVSWGFEDLLTVTPPTEQAEKDTDKESEYSRSIASDGYYLYTTNSSGKGLAKMGTGFHGTLRGYIYTRVIEIGPGRIAWCNGALLYRPGAFDQEANHMCLAQLLHPATLQPISTIPKPETLAPVEVINTVAFCSDGIYLYHLWTTTNGTDKNAKGHNVYMDTYKLEGSMQKAKIHRPRLLIQRKEDSSNRNLNETLLSRIRPYRGSSVAQTLIALTGGEASATNRKEDGSGQSNSAVNTSCGVSLKTLQKTPIFCDGSTLVLLVPLIAGPSASAARSLFGSGGSLSTLKSLATNLCFNAVDGQFLTRLDLMDAPGCSLAGGSALSKVGVSYDSVNNLIWMCSNDYVDEFSNPGHQATHHIRHRLGLSTPLTKQTGAGVMSVTDVVKQLLHHVSSMCLHQLSSDVLTSPFASVILQQCSVARIHLARITDILETGISNHDNHTIVCILVVLQLFFKISALKEQSCDFKDGLLEHTRSLVWHLLTEYKKKQSTGSGQTSCCSVEEEAAQVICVGFAALYPNSEHQQQLLSYLLRNANQSDSLDQLRDSLLVDFSEQFKAKLLTSSGTDTLRLSGQLVQQVLMLSVQQSCTLIQTATDVDKTEFEKMLSEVPRTSPCTRYLAAYQSFLLRELMFLEAPDTDAASEKLASYSSTKETVQGELTELAVKIIKGCSEVAEVLLTQCQAVINKGGDEMDTKLSNMERIAKGTIIGQLLPTMITSLIHSNIQGLGMASDLIPLLIKLVVDMTQITVHMKSHLESVLNKELELTADTDMVGIIGHSLQTKCLDKSMSSQTDFLLGLKIPTPWASGKTVETIHPVRDNYKLKETVHLPGARCLYLRFDPRSASQYDYDKLIVFAGPNTSSKKIAEYGGNTFGFGSRSVLGSGWPKDLVKVEGDTVTFSFEMRSGREHNTPDKAMWGFSVTVRAQESPEDVNGGLPFLADLALGLSSLTCSLLSLMYQGPLHTPDEDACKHLLRSKVLQRCVWKTDEAEKEDVTRKTPHGFSVQTLPRIKLSSEVIHKMRNCSKRPAPNIRPSIREVLQPNVLEEKIMSVIIKHLDLVEAVNSFSALTAPASLDEDSLLSLVLAEVLKRTDALLRQLQALADLEQRWTNELIDSLKEDVTEKEPPFFHDYHLQEIKHKELALLCYLKDVTSDSLDREQAVKALVTCFEHEIYKQKKTPVSSTMVKTKQVVEAICSRLDLLLQVSIGAAAPHAVMSRSMSSFGTVPSVSEEKVGARSRTVGSASISRSLSAPSGVDDDSLLQAIKSQRQRQTQKKQPSSILQDLVEMDECEHPAHVTLISQLFSFIGTDPETAVSCDKFLKSAEVRWQRGKYRKKAFVHMRTLLKAAVRVGGASHLVAAVTSVLRHGPGSQNLACGGMVNQVREAFAETMASVVELAAQNPITNCSSITLLCTVPYTREEEKCLVMSGLVNLLDQLCGVNSQQTKPLGCQSSAQTQHISGMAWAGFQVLASCCVTWETEDESFDRLEHSGLARQVSTLLTHYLTRATEGASNEAASTEALQDVLGLLNNLSRSRMGKAILSQPACVSKLLSLLLDQRPSPKLVLVILQLIRVALPLLNAVDCEAIQLPLWGHHLPSAHWNTSLPAISDTQARIVSLLLAKLGDFLVPGDQVMLSSRTPSQEASVTSQQSQNGDHTDEGENSDMQDGRLAVCVHKRADQTSNEALQPLLSGENRLFRLSSGASVDRVMRMDKELNKQGKAEVTTEDAMAALRMAYKWAQSGLVMSTCCPAPTTPRESGDKKKTAAEEVCKERNTLLARTDPVRPFISSQVANSMAAETISLLHNLLQAPVSSTAQTWAEAAHSVMSNVLSGLPSLLTSLENLSSMYHSRQLMSTAKLVNATVCALGGFQETIKPGCYVEIVGDGVQRSSGNVTSVVTQTEIATVQLDTQNNTASSYSDTVEVPMSRLCPVRNKMFSSPQHEMWDSVLKAVQVMLQPSDNCSPLTQVLPVHGDGNSLANQTCRVIAEIQTRICTLLSIYLEDVECVRQFIETCEPGVDILKTLAKDCSSGNRYADMVAHCQRLRMLYRDCVKPPPPPSESDNRTSAQMVWDPSRSYPPARASLFSQGMTAVTFLGDANAGPSLPRGVFIYASQPIPQQAPSFYWEIELCSFGDAQGDSSPFVSFGFAPAAEKKDGAWTNPVGSCLVHNSGKAVHYNGASLLQWRSVRLDIQLEAGDVIGVGWEKIGESSGPNQASKGKVYFTHKGHLLNPSLLDVAGGMFPVVHIQKKSVRVRANFGGRSFLYAEGQQHREAAEAASDMSKEIRESFSHLPFHSNSSDSEGEESAAVEGESASGSGADKDSKSIPKPPCKTPTPPAPLKEYNSDLCLRYKVPASYEYMPLTGPSSSAVAGLHDDGESDGEMEDDGLNEDHHMLLVRAWEQKVFPVIRRRFRNEAERKDGLEQIRGALQLGMTDIARQTVEFLYEENGGLPRDLHLPTIEDIKEDLSKFTIERVKKGKTVVISSAAKPGLASYAVTGMLKTYGLAGTVLDIDSAHELVQVETYVQSEGVMVRFWYPLTSLEKPPKGFRKSSITGGQTLDTSTVAIHRELIRTEGVLVRMLLRRSLLELIDHCNSPAMGLSACSSGLSTGMTASAAGLQELDIENLQLLSDHLLASPTPTGGLVHNFLPNASSTKICMAPNSCAFTDIVYQNSARIKRELAIAIARAANQGEDYVIELTTQICQCLQNAPELFLFEELNVSEVKVTTDLCFPGAACLVVSCMADTSPKKENVPYRSPWARIFTYTGRKVDKYGQATKQEVVCYPMENSGSTSVNQFEPVVIPGDQIHVKLGVSPPPGVTLTVHALPKQFVMAIAYLETIVTEKFGCGLRACRMTKGKFKQQVHLGELSSHPSLWSLDNIVISEGVMFHAIELVCTYLRRTNIPAVIKEYIFHILAQALRILHVLTGRRNSLLDKFESHVVLFSVFRQLQKELKILKSTESQQFQHGSTCSGPGMGIGVTDHGVFSTYFHSLMEVNLAIGEVLGCDKSVLQFDPPAVPAEDSASISKSASASKKKKQKTKKDKERLSSTSSSTASAEVESSSSSDVLSESSSNASAFGSATATSSSSKEETTGDEMAWFHRALALSNSLRAVALDEAFAQSFLSEAIGNASRSLLISTVHERLLVVSGIPRSLNTDTVKHAIYKACDLGGSIDWEEIFVPEPLLSKSLEKNPGDKETSSKSDVSKNQGFVVLNLPSKSVVETVQKSLLKSKELTGVGDNEHAADVSGDMFGVSVVSPALLTEANANIGLETYLRWRLMSDNTDGTMRNEAVHAITDIFYSCFFVCQQQGLSSDRQESGFICLDAEQILFNSCENLLCTFFNNIRPQKKPLSDHVSHVLRQYGLSITPDKDVSSPAPGLGKNGKSRSGKKSPRSAKEKSLLGKTADKGVPSKDKTTKFKESLEKSFKETGASSEASIKAAKAEKKKDTKALTLEGFFQYITEMIKHDVRQVWRALLACGLDIKLKRLSCIDLSQAEALNEQWTGEMDAALVQHVNDMSEKLRLASARIHPHEINFSDDQLASQKSCCLQGVPPESIRLRFALLQQINNSLETFLLPLVDLRPAQTFSCSTAALIFLSHDSIFYDNKVSLCNRILNATAKRRADQAAPEITLDPLEDIEGERKSSQVTVFCQAFRQLQSVSSRQLCVRLASGGDPTYAFLVRLVGEEVHGTSGSFRQFLWQVSRELQGHGLSLLIPCPSSSSGVNQGRYILHPGPMTYQEQQLLYFFGQLLGITMRADIPLGLDLLSTFWKCFIGQTVNAGDDLKEADILTYNYLKKIEMVETESELLALCSNTYPQFVYATLDGGETQLQPQGRQINVSWSNRQEYMDSIRQLRLQELTSPERMRAMVAGFSTIIPVQLVTLFSPHDLGRRISGLPEVNLSFLKAHTMYQVGLMESDRHIEFFWNTLEMFSQEELARFIKFACNQERIPQTCPCQSGGSDATHVPPYPMKIAPPDGSGPADGRYVRAETCMFMIKLPQYSCLEIMSQRLKYAISCREDPLSG